MLVGVFRQQLVVLQLQLIELLLHSVGCVVGETDGQFGDLRFLLLGELLLQQLHLHREADASDADSSHWSSSRPIRSTISLR